MNHYRDRNSYRHIWVLVDKRGDILDHSMWRMHNFPGYCPGAIWANRFSARHTLNSLKEKTSKEAWKTWQFKVVGFSRLPQFNP